MRQDNEGGGGVNVDAVNQMVGAKMLRVKTCDVNFEGWLFIE